MIREITSSLFAGFYETMYSNSDEFIDYEKEDECIILSYFPFLDKDKFWISYEYGEMWNEYKSDVGEAFSEKYLEYLLGALPYEITYSDNFLLEKVNNIEIYSPKYYNYSTDSCTFKINTNVETLNMIKDYVLSQKEAENYILEHHSSCDGFISFISNDIDYWKSLDVEDYEENMLSALLDMCLRLYYDNICSDENVYFSINYDVYEVVEKFCYVSRIANYKCDNGFIEMDIFEFVEYVINRLKAKYPNYLLKYNIKYIYGEF